MLFQLFSRTTTEGSADAPNAFTALINTHTKGSSLSSSRCGVVFELGNQNSLRKFDKTDQSFLSFIKSFYYLIKSRKHFGYPGNDAAFKINFNLKKNHLK